MSIVDELMHLFPETISGQPGTLDNRGTFTASGDPVVTPCRFEGGSRMVRNASGQEVVSTLRAIVAGTPGYTASGYRFTIPSRFAPYQNLVAINVDKWADATDFVYEEVSFP